MTAPEVDPTAYELLRPEHLEQVLHEAPIVYVPIGCMEFHGPHLPLGVDMLTADALCHRAAEVTGGVVLPPLWTASGVLPLPHGIVMGLDALRGVIRPTLGQLARGGFKVIVVLSGHGALDHLHVLREETDRVMEEFPEVNALTTMWNELNTNLEGDIHDHGAKVETSYMMEFYGETVDLTGLADDPAAEHVGIYAANPRFTASREWGATMSDNAVNQLAALVAGYRKGGRADSWTLFAALIERLQSGNLAVVPDSGKLAESGFSFELHNPHSQSKYITAVEELTLDGMEVDLSGGTISNRSSGEGHTDTAISDLSPLAGFYIRRGQNMVVGLPQASVLPGKHRMKATFQLADVLAIGAEGTIAVV